MGRAPGPRVPDLRRLTPAVPEGAAVLLAPARPGRPTRYDVRSGASGATVLVPRGDRPLREQVDDGRPRGLRAGTVRAVRGALPRAGLTVAGPVPALVTAAVPGRPGARTALLAGGGGPRRRGVLIVAPPTGPADLVIKAGPYASTAERAAGEQVLLRRVAAAAPGLGPKPLGGGSTGPWAWSAETLLPGWPLSEALGDESTAGRRRTAAVLEALSGHLGRLAHATAGRLDPGTVRLRGPCTDLAPLLARLVGVPGVLVHGDLATAHNVLVQGTATALVDWETAAPGGLPLLDLLPLAALATARAAGATSTGAQAAYSLRLCAGKADRSGWFLALIASACGAGGVRLEDAGTVAALAWGHLASMPLVHVELARQAGQEVEPWPTAAQDVAAAWLSHPGLGEAWPALRASA